MAKDPRLFVIAGMGNDDREAVMDQFRRLTKAQWCELFHHLYQQWSGQEPICFAVEDVEERLKVIESHCRSMGPLGRH